MDTKTKEEIDLIPANLNRLKEEIDLYTAALYYFKDNDPETNFWKWEAAKLINVMLEYSRSRVEDWTTQIINGVKVQGAFDPEILKHLNALDMTPKSKGETPEKENQ